MKQVTVFAFALTLSVATAVQADSLTIERGYYVRSDTSCQQASNATITLFNGISFCRAHIECRKPGVRKKPDGSYQITEQCRDMQGRGGPWTAFITSYAVLSRTEFISTTLFEKAAYRYCKQSDLPDPWSTVDLSSLGVR